jgi:hypothetical protein
MVGAVKADQPAMIRLSSRARSVRMACRMGNDDAQLADESSCVEPYAAIYREHFE